jgi:undecaprenyl pyrophosphate phosphatase UppP
LIGIPFTGLSGLAITVTSGQLQFISDIELLAAFITAFLSGILTLRIMMNKVASYSFWKVCLLLGLLSFASLIFISP